MKSRSAMWERIEDTTLGHTLTSSELTILHQLEEDFGFSQGIVPIATVRFFNLFLRHDV